MRQTKQTTYNYRCTSKHSHVTYCSIEYKALHNITLWQGNTGTMVLSVKEGEKYLQASYKEVVHTSTTKCSKNNYED